MKKQRRKLDRDRFCNNVIPQRGEHNDFIFAQHSRSHRRRVEQAEMKGKKDNSVIIYNKVYRGSIQM